LHRSIHKCDITPGLGDQSVDDSKVEHNILHITSRSSSSSSSSSSSAAQLVPSP
jgi:hypothetical protein